VSTRTQTQLPILLVEDSDEDYAALVRALNGAAIIAPLHRCTRGEVLIRYHFDYELAQI
jgi:hypothetical protein